MKVVVYVLTTTSGRYLDAFASLAKAEEEARLYPTRSEIFEKTLFYPARTEDPDVR